MERPGIGDDKAHAPSKPEPLQVCALAVEVSLGVGAEYALAHQECVKLRPCLKSEKATQLGSPQMPVLEFFKREGFEHAAFQLAGSAQAIGKIIGNAYCHIHR